MRAFSILSVILGISVYGLAGCSSDSDAESGAGGDTSTAGSSGKAGSSSAGAAGEVTGAAGETMTGSAGASSCAFDSPACSKCLVDNCPTEVKACSEDTDCGGALSNLEPCACDPDKTPLMCETAFIGDGGTKAQPLVDCFNDNCASACTM